MSISLGEYYLVYSSFFKGGVMCTHMTEDF